MNQNLSQEKDKFPSFRKLIVLLMVLVLALPSFSQITVNVQNKTLRQTLSEIEKASDYRFFYNESLAVLSKNTSIQVTNADIDNVMQRILAGTGITYEKNNNIIALVENANANQTPAAAQQNKVTVRGRILDAAGVPVIGANIIEEGVPGNGTVSDYDGNFSLNITRSANLKISYLGYSDVVLNTAGRNTFDVVMEENTEMLSEVVVTAWVSSAKRKHLDMPFRRLQETDCKR